MSRRTTVVNLRNGAFDVYIGRVGHGHDGYFGNPHPVGQCWLCGTYHLKVHAIEAFRVDFLTRVKTDKEFARRVLALKGKVLGCFCAPAACHGDVIAEWLNERR